MRVLFRRTKFFVIGIIVLSGILPIIWFKAIYGNVPIVDADKAVAILTNPKENAILIDVRSPELFNHQHVVGAQHWPLEQILTIQSVNQIPYSWKGKKLLFLSTAGFASSTAVQSLTNAGMTDIYNIRGGMQEYIAALNKYSIKHEDVFILIAGEPAFRVMSEFEQWAVILGAFVFKPIHMFLGFLMVIVLWKAQRLYLVTLKYSMLIFCIGEAWCAVNYLFFNHTSLLSEFLHSYGMVVAFGLAIYAAIDGIDTYLIRLSAREQRCTALEICEQCIKYEDVDCRFRKVLLLLLPAVSSLALIPLLVSPSTESYNTLIFENLYNYSRLYIYQTFEIRYSPILAIVLLSLAFWILLRQHKRPLSNSVRILTAGGLGALIFAFFRLLLGKIYINSLVWADFWEEETELLFVIAAWSILLIFKNTLLGEISDSWSWTFLRQKFQRPTTAPTSALRPPTAKYNQVVLIACKVLQDQLIKCLPKGMVKETYYMKFELHHSPMQLRQSIQSVIDALIEPSLVVLGYGLCGNGLHGISARQHMLIVPRVNDCIPMVMGSYHTYLQYMRNEPATFFISQGWLESGSHPLNEHRELVQRYGPDDADMIIDDQYRYIRCLAFVYNNSSVRDSYKESAREVALFCQRWGAKYQEIAGSDAYIHRLLEVIRDPDSTSNDFLIISPGEIIQSHQFLRGN